MAVDPSIFGLTGTNFPVLTDSVFFVISNIAFPFVTGTGPVIVASTYCVDGRADNSYKINGASIPYQQSGRFDVYAVNGSFREC
jgi:hypothetical protein